MVDAIPRRPSPRDQAREERLEILRLLETGSISVDEAATLLDALDDASDRTARPSVVNGTEDASNEARKLRIRITDGASGRAVVNLAVPLGLLKSGLEIAGQFVPEYLPQADVIRESLKSGFHGTLVDVDDGEQRVEVIAE